jgi:hypothetical protein
LRASYHKEGGAPPAHAVRPSQIAVMGDSTACTLMPALEAVAPSFGAQIQNGAVIGCGIVSGRIAPIYLQGVDLEGDTGDCQGKADAAESPILRNGHPNVIVWESTFEKDSILVDTPHGPKVLTAGTPAWRSVMSARMRDRLDQFLATGAKVIVVLQPPFVNSGKPTRPTASDHSFERLNGLLEGLAKRHPGRVGLVNLSTLVCPSGPPCPYNVAGLTPRPDGGHYGPAGSLWAASWLVPQIITASHALSG